MAENAQIRVKSSSDVKALARSISKALDGSVVVEVQSIGAGATNQAVKAIALCRGIVASKGKDVVTRPGFGDTVIDGKDKTVIKLFVTTI